MHYKLYLHTLCQLSNKGLATLELDESIVFIEPIKEQRSIYPQLRKKKSTTYRLSAKLFESRENISSQALSCISRVGVFRWQQKGAYLHLDRAQNAVYLIDEIEIPTNSYISFKQKIGLFLDTLRGWKEA